MKKILSDDMQVIIELKNQEPVDLLYFSNSMIAFSNEYATYLDENDLNETVPDSRLYIKEMKSGSIIATIGVLASASVPLFDQFNTVFEFAQSFGVCVDYLLGKGEKPNKLSKSTLQNISKIVNPVAMDKSSQLNVQTLTVNGDITIHTTINSLEANAVQNAANREIAQLKEPVLSGIYENVLLYWDNASNTNKTKSTDRARIDSISKKALRVTASEHLKERLLFGSSNPFKKAFLVDVRVHTINDAPHTYEVLELNQIIDRD